MLNATAFFQFDSLEFAPLSTFLQNCSYQIATESPLGILSLPLTDGVTNLNSEALGSFSVIFILAKTDQEQPYS